MARGALVWLGVGVVGLGVVEGMECGFLCEVVEGVDCCFVVDAYVEGHGAGEVGDECMDLGAGGAV